MTTNDTTTTTIPARNLRAGMIANQGLYGKGEPTVIREVEPWTGELGGDYVTITFDDVEHTNTTYTVPAHHGFDVRAVVVEMWTVNDDGTPGDTYTLRYPLGMRRHDMLRNLATYALATHDVGSHYTRVPRKHIRVNSTQGIAWDTRNPSNVAYFAN